MCTRSTVNLNFKCDNLCNMFDSSMQIQSIIPNAPSDVN